MNRKHNRSHGRRARNRALSRGPITTWGAILAILCAVGLVILPVGRASAADIGAGLTNVATTLVSGPASTTEHSGQAYDMAFNACLPSSAQSGDSWSVTLPSQLTSWPAGFNITNPNDSNDTWIKVTITDGVATFTLTDSGAAQSNLCFRSQFGGTLKDSVTAGQQTLTTTVHGGVTSTTGTIEVTTGPTGGSYPPEDDGKWLGFNDPSDQCRTTTADCITAGVWLAGGDRGVVTITEKSQPNWTFDCSATPSLVTDTYDGSGGVTQSWDQSRFKLISCSPTSVVATVDTAGSRQSETSFTVIYTINAVAPGGSGLVTYANDATISNDQGSEQVSASIQSTYVGGSADGAGIYLKKTDAAGNHAPDPSSPVSLDSGSTGLVFSIQNNGTQALTDIEVSDEVIAGSGTVSDLNCTFPDGSTGTTWAGPFATNSNFTCTAQLSGVSGAHEDRATVTAKGDAGTPLNSSDTYNAVTTPPSSSPTSPSSTTSSSTTSPSTSPTSPSSTTSSSTSSTSTTSSPTSPSSTTSTSTTSSPTSPSSTSSTSTSSSPTSSTSTSSSPTSPRSTTSSPTSPTSPSSTTSSSTSPTSPSSTSSTSTTVPPSSSSTTPPGTVTTTGPVIITDGSSVSGGNTGRDPWVWVSATLLLGAAVGLLTLRLRH